MELARAPAGASGSSASDRSDDSGSSPYTGSPPHSGSSPASASSSPPSGPPPPHSASPVRQVLTDADLSRTLTRIAHQILERTDGGAGVVLLGIPTRGVLLARR